MGAPSRDGLAGASAPEPCGLGPSDGIPSAELVSELRRATRVNMPYLYGTDHRVVGFVLSNDIAWPKGHSACDILDYLLSLVPASAIEAGTDATGTSAAEGESAVGNAETPKDRPNPPVQP